jgi:positive regulator of sigma E activity
MEDAFDLNNEHQDDDDHEGTETTPLTHTTQSQQAESSSSGGQSSVVPIPTYDFERYDFPPPGSPPRPSSQALPNDHGNSNGYLPTSPIVRPQLRQSFFRRFTGALFPSQYQPVATESHQTQPTGGGTDGVFANVMAKPVPARTVVSDSGEVHIVPEETQKDAPPSYQEAQADAVPPYWETVIHAPGLNSGSDLFIDDLPIGSFFMFCATTFISFFFQFIGFLVTYLLHTTHAAKYGSRAGLGLTLIQYGFYSRNRYTDPQADEQGTHGTWVSDALGPGGTPTETSHPVPVETVSTHTRDWLSILFMTLGWFLLLTSILGFWRVKRFESSIRQRPNPNPPSAEEVERDRDLTHNLQEIFGIPPPGELHRNNNNQTTPQTPDLESWRRDENLHRDLRAAALV